MKHELFISPKKIRNRRVAVFGLMFLSVILATIKFMSAIPTDVSFFTGFFIVFLFVLTFAWISLFFWSSIFGFFELMSSKKLPDISGIDISKKLNSKTAILMPVYNESSQDVFANLLAIAQDLKDKNQTSNFDIFVLSDTTNPKCWVEEEKTWFDAKKLMPENMNLYYRRRPKNIARKSGNIEDFCNKWGANYDFMVVLDADSLLIAETIIKMAILMEDNDDAGILQAPPANINRNTLFARMQQFAGKVYGPIVGAGLAYWQGRDSNYWGHNAIIRVKAFIECCGLPVLKGKAPFGGHILSHDFVEAALISRGGWSAWLLPELKGSYEECPPTIIDFAARDRRWCQGNMQHIKVLISKKINAVSRIHFTTGIMSYLSSLLWLCFLLAGLFIAFGKIFFPPIYFQEARTLFPDWPIFDRLGVIVLFIISMFMLVFPKFLGYIVYVKQNKVGWFSPLKSVLVEIVLSALLSAIMMLFQSKFIVDIFAGKSVGWNTQTRGDLGTSFKDAFNRHVWHTALGIVTSILVWMYANELFYWMLPVTIGLILSIPISILTSKVSLGVWARKHKYFVIPEEIIEPEIVINSKKYYDLLMNSKAEFKGVELVVRDNIMNSLHIMMLGVNGPKPDIAKDDLLSSEVKLYNYINHGLEMNLSSSEEIALLYSPEILKNANLSLLMD